MTDTLAADAALIELSDDDVVELLADETPNPLAVRDALLELASIESKTTEVATLRRQIVERYDEKIGRLAGRASAIRDSLKVYCERFGKASFPDVGGVHLTTRKGKARVADSVAFEDYVRESLPKVAAASTFTVEQFDIEQALAFTLDELDVTWTTDGRLVRNETGEVVEIPGVEAVADSKSVTVRKS